MIVGKGFRKETSTCCFEILKIVKVAEKTLISGNSEHAAACPNDLFLFTLTHLQMHVHTHIHADQMK